MYKTLSQTSPCVKIASAGLYSTIFLATPSESRNSWTLKLRPLLDLMPAEYLPSGNEQCSQLNRRLDSPGYRRASLGCQTGIMHHRLADEESAQGIVNTSRSTQTAEKNCARMHRRALRALRANVASCHVLKRGHQASPGAFGRPGVSVLI